MAWKKDWKETIWSELDIHDCEILNVTHNQDGSIGAVQIKHQLLKLPRWFMMSQNNNLYSRNIGKRKEPYAHALIIKNWQENELLGGESYGEIREDEEDAER